MSNISSYSALWKRLEKGVIYSILEGNAFYVLDEPEDWEEHLTIRFFITPNAAEQYRSDLVERGLYKPSELSVHVVTVKEITEMKDEFAALGEELYSLPVRVTVVDMYEGGIIAEDTLIDTTMEIN